MNILKDSLKVFLIVILTLLFCAVSDIIYDNVKSYAYGYIYHNYTRYRIEYVKWYVFPKTLTYRYGRTIAGDLKQCIGYRDSKSVKYVRMGIVKNDKEVISWTAKGKRK